MAEITSAQSGYFTDPTVWVGGVVPGAFDTATAATGHIIDIAAAVQVLELRQTGTGHFVLHEGVHLFGDVYGGSLGFANANLGCVTCVAEGAAYLYGNVFGGATPTATAVSMIGGGILTIYGSVTGGSNNTSCGVLAVNGSVRVFGVCNAGSHVSSRGILATGSCRSIFVQGNLEMFTGIPLVIQSTDSEVVYVEIIGDIQRVSGTATSTAGVQVSNATVDLKVTGLVLGQGIGPAGSGIYFLTNSHGFVSVVGSVRGSQTGAADGIHLAISCSVVVSVLGSVEGGVGTLGHGVYSIEDNIVEVDGVLMDGVNGACAVAGHRLFLKVNFDSSTVWHVNPAGTQFSVREPLGAGGDHPEPEYVLEDVTYAFGALTGTMKVPPREAVRAGVPVNYTVGTAALSPQDIWSVPVSTLTAPGSMGERLLQDDVSAVVEALLDEYVEPNFSLRGSLRLILAAAAGKLLEDGDTITIRDVNDSIDRIIATVDSSGNRLSVLTDTSD